MQGYTQWVIIVCTLSAGEGGQGDVTTDQSCCTPRRQATPQATTWRRDVSVAVVWLRGSHTQNTTPVWATEWRATAVEPLRYLCANCRTAVNTSCVPLHHARHVRSLFWFTWLSVDFDYYYFFFFLLITLFLVAPTGFGNNCFLSSYVILLFRFDIRWLAALSPLFRPLHTTWIAVSTYLTSYGWAIWAQLNEQESLCSFCHWVEAEEEEIPYSSASISASLLLLLLVIVVVVIIIKNGIMFL